MSVQFKVWHIPQIPMKAFEVEVPDAATGRLLSSALCDYDLFQFENRIKPDYANASGVVWKCDERTGGEWEDLEEEDEE